MTSEEKKLTEIARSYSYKLALPGYSNADFFMSQKVECPLDEVEEWSKRLFDYCKSSVEKEVNDYIQAHLPEDQKVINIDAGVKL